MITKKYLYTNAIKCKLCNTVIESEHRHDYKTCVCGAVGVDGGHEYQRVIGEPHNIENMSVWTNKPFWISIDPKTDKRIKIFMEDLTDEHLANIVLDGYDNEDIAKEARKRWGHNYKGYCMFKKWA